MASPQHPEPTDAFADDPGARPVDYASQHPDTGQRREEPFWPDAHAKWKTRALVAEAQVEQLQGELRPLRSLAQWLVALDEPEAAERRTVTLTTIIDQARQALNEPTMPSAREALAPDASKEKNMASDQQRFENKAREAARALEQGALDLATAATLAAELDDTFACGGLHMLRESLFRQIELIEEEIAAVDARLADGLAPAGEAAGPDRGEEDG